MYKTYFKQAIQLLKQNPFISTISILGTALAIMMIMVIIVSNSIHNVSVKPEVNRSKSFYSFFYAVRDTANGNEWLGQLKYEEVRDYFHSLQTPEEVTAFEANSLLNGYRKSTVQREGDKELHKIRMRFVDNAFWRVFAFDFVQGAPFTQEEFESGVRKAVISESTAQRLFKGENPIGKNMLISNISYNVAGVVKDVSQVFSKAYGDVFAPYTSKQGYDKQMSYLVLMLMKSSRDHSRLAEELRSMERKYEALHPDRNYTLGMWGHSDIEAVREHISSYGYDSITIKVTDLLRPQPVGFQRIAHEEAHGGNRHTQGVWCAYGHAAVSGAVRKHHYLLHRRHHRADTFVRCYTPDERLDIRCGCRRSHTAASAHIAYRLCNSNSVLRTAEHHVVGHFRATRNADEHS